ncbi:MAG TPA: class I SAM-dependent methyltransferase [Verrucomicrobiae bacterium]|nr:class I SAM-dependent methyltransferase [Verrucomicrobiae bacterium]
MRKLLAGNGNGNGNGSGGLLQQSKKRTAPPPPDAPSPEARESRVSFQTREGLELRGAPVRITRHHIAFEVFNPSTFPQLSEVIDKFTLVLQARTVYSGRAVVSNVVDTGGRIVCEATLDEAQWTDLNHILALQSEGQIAREFTSFLRDWQKFYTVSPEFKLIVADMQTFFHDLRLWLEQVELGIQALDKNARGKFEPPATREIAGVVIPLIDALFEKFEDVAKGIREEQRTAHARYMRQHLHSLILAAPFAYRTFEKPLGYPGDYEMVNMILRNGYEGDSLFAKIVHHWFVRQPPAAAHRNRIKYLTERIELEAYRVARGGGKARVFDFACGPAVEVQNFFRSSFSDKVELTLADFNAETLEYVGQMLAKIKNFLEVRTNVRFQKKTVYQLLKENYKSTGKKPQYDFVYCAGLFDYLPDTTCRQLMDVFYDFVAPGGLLVATNVEPSNPLRYGMEHLLDWHLLYRREPDLRALRPVQADPDEVTVRTDATGVNLFIEVRKPAHD